MQCKKKNLRINIKEDKNKELNIIINKSDLIESFDFSNINKQNESTEKKLLNKKRYINDMCEITDHKNEETKVIDMSIKEKLISNNSLFDKIKESYEYLSIPFKDNITEQIFMNKNIQIYSEINKMKFDNNLYKNITFGINPLDYIYSIQNEIKKDFPKNIHKSEIKKYKMNLRKQIEINNKMELLIKSFPVLNPPVQNGINIFFPIYNIKSDNQLNNIIKDKSSFINKKKLFETQLNTNKNKTE